MTRRITYRYRRPGKGEQTFEQWLVLDRPDVKVLLTDSYNGERLTVNDEPILDPGAPIVWYVFPDKWHDIGRFHLADETFTGWYTNFVTPVEMAGDTWRATDLFLDLWQPAEGEPVWLDEDELEQAVKSGLLDRATAKRIENERSLIVLQLGGGAWPPAIARDIDLAQARALRQT